MQSAVHCKAWLMFGIYSHYEQVVVLVAPHITFHYIVIHCITLHYNGIYSHYSQVVVLLAPHRVGMHCHLPSTHPQVSGVWSLGTSIDILPPKYMQVLSIYLYCYRKFHLHHLRYLGRILVPTSLHVV